MPSVPIDLITISREYGSGGGELSRALAERLHWRVLDQELVRLVAEALQLDPQTVERMDECPPTLLMRLSAALLVTAPECPLPGYAAPALIPDAAADASRAAILDAAEQPPLIVVGHGSQCLLHARPGTLHVRLVANIDDRVRRVCLRDGCTPEQSAVRARKMDELRIAYVRRYFHRDLRDPQLYDLQIDTSRVSIADAATRICHLVASRPAAQPSNA